MLHECDTLDDMASHLWRWTLKFDSVLPLAPACCPGATGQRPSALPLTDRGDGGHNLAELQLVQDGRFTSRIKSHLQHSAGKGFAGCRSFAGAGRLLHQAGKRAVCHRSGAGVTGQLVAGHFQNEVLRDPP